MSKMIEHTDVDSAKIAVGAEIGKGANTGAMILAATAAAIPPDVASKHDTRVLATSTDMILLNNTNNNDQDTTVRLMNTHVPDRRSGC